jgi:outer membrane protein TolC
MIRICRGTRNRSILLSFSILTISFAAVAPAQTLPEQGRVPQGAQGESPSEAAVASTELGNQSPFLGSVPTGKATPEVLQLSMKEALDRGLKYNLGLLVGEQGVRSARGQSWKALSDLLPKVTARVAENVQQIDLAAFGISVPGVPSVVGPFSVFESRAFLYQPVLDFKALESVKASREKVSAAEYSYKDARDLVVLVVGNAYLLADAEAARVEAAEAQMRTAQSLYEKARDMLKAGLTPSIDQLRAQVELEARQQVLLAVRNESEKQKLNLARAIGLPVGQKFVLTDRIPYQTLQPVSLEDALRRAYSSRSDYQRELARVRAAERARKAAVAERLPSLAFNADYGDIGVRPGSSHGTVTLAGTLNIPLFQGGKVRGDVLEADAALRQRQSELEDLRGRIDYEVRTALMDLRTAAERLAVAKSSLDLATQTLAQAQDRFVAGVVDNLEVVQAQEALANANEAYIASLYAHNFSKVSLARAEGIAEQAVSQYLGGK